MNGKATIKYPCLDVIFLVKMFADWGQWLICSPSHSLLLEISWAVTAVSSWEEHAQGCIAWLASWCWPSLHFFYWTAFDLFLRTGYWNLSLCDRNLFCRVLWWWPVILHPSTYNLNPTALNCISVTATID